MGFRVRHHVITALCAAVIMLALTVALTRYQDQFGPGIKVWLCVLIVVNAALVVRAMTYLCMSLYASWLWRREAKRRGFIK